MLFRSVRPPTPSRTALAGAGCAAGTGASTTGSARCATTGGGAGASSATGFDAVDKSARRASATGVPVQPVATAAAPTTPASRARLEPDGATPASGRSLRGRAPPGLVPAMGPSMAAAGSWFEGSAQGPTRHIRCGLAVMGTETRRKSIPSDRYTKRRQAQNGGGSVCAVIGERERLRCPHTRPLHPQSPLPNPSPAAAGEGLPEPPKPPP